MISLAGGLAGLALGALIVQALGKFGLDRFPRASEVHINVPVVLFTLIIVRARRRRNRSAAFGAHLEAQSYNRTSRK
jgi:hypothetical protein